MSKTPRTTVDFTVAAQLFSTLRFKDQYILLGTIPTLLDKGPEGKNFARNIVKAFVEAGTPGKKERRDLADELTISLLAASEDHEDFIFEAAEKIASRNEFPDYLAEMFDTLMMTDFDRGASLYKATVEKSNGFGFMRPGKLAQIAKSSQRGNMIFDHAEALVNGARKKKASYMQDPKSTAQILDSTADRLPEFMSMDAGRTILLGAALKTEHPNLLEYILKPQKAGQLTILERLAQEDEASTGILLDSVIKTCAVDRHMDVHSLSALSMHVLEEAYPEQARTLKEALKAASTAAPLPKEPAKVQKAWNARSARKEVNQALAALDLDILQP